MILGLQGTDVTAVLLLSFLLLNEIGAQKTSQGHAPVASANVLFAVKTAALPQSFIQSSSAMQQRIQLRDKAAGYAAVTSSLS